MSIPLDSLSIQGESFSPSPLQESIFHHLSSSMRNIAVLAVAGSGKTTTAVEAFKRPILTSTQYPSIFLAFNKRIADELLSRGVPASTFHALAYRAFPGKRPRVDTWKLRNIVKRICRLDVEDQETVLRLVPLLKNAAITPLSDSEEFLEIAEHFDIECNSHIVKCCERVLRACAEDLSSIDFDDMLWIPFVKGWPIGRFSFIAVDETQDTNRLQRELLHRIQGSPRFLFIGDPAQSIYGFRGADSNAFQALIEEFNCLQLPLDVSYRCPKAIVQEAHKYHSHIRPAEIAPDGNVLTLPFSSIDFSKFLSRAAIICRNTRPLIPVAYSLIRKSIAAHVIGRDLGDGLKRLAKRFRAKTLDELTAKLISARDAELLALTEAGKNAQAEAVSDRYNTLLEILDSSPFINTPEDLPIEIDRLFSSKQESCIQLSTIHKAKGLEWPVVFWLSPELLPSRFATQEWELEQERNLGYVAVTRAKESLIYLT